GAVIPASSSPHVVPLPLSVEANVDPEEAFVASLSSCHMLFFLSIAAKRRWVVDRYSDDAIGTMAEDDTGRLAMTQVLLQPVAQFQGVAPSQEQIEQVHHQAHEMCFIANSVKTRVLVTPKPFRNEST
ncbi:MAG: OsmC family protein, partial [Pseudomonadota bacterium]